MADLTFYYCTVCGAMSMQNFRDAFCMACHTTMKVNQVDLYFDELSHVEVGPAPHTVEDTDG